MGQIWYQKKDLEKSVSCRTPAKFANHLLNAAANFAACLPIAAANLQRRLASEVAEVERVMQQAEARD